MAYEANFRPATGAVAALRESEALRAGWRVFWPTRLAVFLVAVFAALAQGPPGEGGLAEINAAKYDSPALTAPAGGLGRIVLPPLARWDAVWYLRVANSGYRDGGPEAAFFPLYPALARGLGHLARGAHRALGLGRGLTGGRRRHSQRGGAARGADRPALRAIRAQGRAPRGRRLAPARPRGTRRLCPLSRADTGRPGGVFLGAAFLVSRLRRSAR